MNGWAVWIQDRVAEAIEALERIAAACERIADEAERPADNDDYRKEELSR